MADKLMCIPNDTQNYPICRLQFVNETFDTKRNEPANQNLIKVTKVIKLTIKKTLV